MSEGKGTRVTAEELDSDGQAVEGTAQSVVIKDDYNLVCDGDTYVANVQAYPKSGIHVITVKNVGGARS